jgi:hypothetical protein
MIQSLVNGTLLLAALLPAPAAGAEVTDIEWSAEGRFVHETRVAPGEFVELCGKLPAGLKVRWEFASDTRLHFNVHYHLGEKVMYASRLSAVAKGRNTLNARTAQDYCWMWSNKSTEPASLAVTLKRE